MAGNSVMSTLKTKMQGLRDELDSMRDELEAKTGQCEEQKKDREVVCKKV